METSIIMERESGRKESLLGRITTHSPIHQNSQTPIPFFSFSILCNFSLNSLNSLNPLSFLSFFSLYTFLSNVFGMYPILQLDPVLSPYQKYLASTEDKECQIHQNCLENGSCHGPAVFRIVDGAHHGLMAGFKQQTKNR